MHWVPFGGFTGKGYWEPDRQLQSQPAQRDIFSELSDFLSKASTTFTTITNIWRPPPPPPISPFFSRLFVNY